MELPSYENQGSWYKLMSYIVREYLVENELTTEDVKQMKLGPLWAWLGEKVQSSELFENKTEFAESIGIDESDLDLVLNTLSADPFTFCRHVWFFWPMLVDLYSDKSKAPTSVGMTLSINYDDVSFQLPMVSSTTLGDRFGVGAVCTTWRMMLSRAEGWLRSIDFASLKDNPEIWAGAEKCADDGTFTADF